MEVYSIDLYKCPLQVFFVDYSLSLKKKEASGA